MDMFKNYEVYLLHIARGMRPVESEVILNVVAFVFLVLS
jgi:hypothetical protein